MPVESDKDIVKIGSRKSRLALLQTTIIQEELKALKPDVTFEVITMDTIGDKNLNKALSKIGEKSLFTRELEQALHQGEVDIVVHSLKDLPTSLPPGMAIGAVSRREDPTDAVVIKKSLNYRSLEELPPDSIVGTSSLRRIAQLKAKYGHLKFETIRGNLNTRLSKLDDREEFSAIVLASAGLKRMGLESRISQVLNVKDCLYAVGQGALAVECRDKDENMLMLLSQICHQDTLLSCLAERSFMKTLEGGCSVPVAVDTCIEEGKLKMTGGVFTLDGSRQIKDSIEVSLPQPISTHQRNCENGAMNEPASFCGIVAPHIPKELLEAASDAGATLATKLLHSGARLVLDEVRKSSS